MDYHTPDPIAKGVWDCFADDVVCAVHVGIDPPTVCGVKHPPRDPSAHIAVAVSNRFSIQKAALAGVALIDNDDRDVDQFRFVLEHRDKPGMRYAHEVLVILPSDGNLLFPPIVFANHEGTNALARQQVNDASAMGMEVVRGPARAPGGEPFHQAGGARFPELGLQLCLPLVVALIDVL